jgi:hypothetical protein
MAAVPPTATVANMSGTYNMNKTLSDSHEDTLKLQNVGWIVRKVAANSAISITMKDYVEADGVRRIDLDQTSTGGMKNGEERWLDYQWKEKDDQIGGKVKGRCKECPLSEIDEPYLKEGFEESEPNTVYQEIESVADKWKVRQTWGFGVIDGQRRHIRRIITEKGSESKKIRLVYDWAA